MTQTQQTPTEILLRDVTAAQRQASDPQTSVWVGASAGSGKTKVLADRVSRLLLDGVRPERILCLTFTRAAAAEMSIRLTQRLSNWATCDQEKLDQELFALQGHAANDEQRNRARRLFAQVLACPGGMRIQTIHAFAQEVLRRFPLEAGLAPHFTVMEEADAHALWEESLDNLLQRVAQEKNTPLAQAFALLVTSLGEHSLRGVLKEARAQEQRLEAAIRQAGDMDALAMQIRARLDLGPDDTQEALIAHAVREGAFDRAKLTQAAQLLIEKSGARYAPRGRKMADWLEQDEQGRCNGLGAYMRAFLTQKGEAYAEVANKALLEDQPWIEDVLKAEAQRLLSLSERLDCVRCADETAALVLFAHEAIEAYRTGKAAHAVLDYDDLIARANALLTRPDMAPWVLYKLDGGIDHILVDESQDTNPAQWRIIEALANEYFAGEGAFPERLRTLFVVGDEKQSIYSFLKADPEEFARMRAHFASHIRAAEKPFEEVPLNVSFRSAPAILRAVDAVFEKDEVRAGVSRDVVRHSAFRNEGAGRVEVWPLFVPPEEEKKTGKRTKEVEDWVLPLGYETVHDPVAALAEHLAAQIKTWIADGHTVYDKELKTERAMNAGDVMVLVQTRGAFVDLFVRALKREGVPVSGVDRMRLTQQLAVMDMTALLQFALLPEDDLTLACVLRGPLMGASEEQLMELAIGRSGSLWASLNAKAAQNDVYAAWRDYLRALLDQADQTPPLPLLVRLLNQPCPADERSGRRAIAARLGPDAEDPLDELLNEAEDFGATHSPSLQSFLHWLDSTEAEIKREMEQAVHRVRITTVHASKGLESPIVILPDTVRVPDKNKLDKIVWDGAGALPFYVPREPSNAYLRGLRAQAYARQMEEDRRLLYVAMTRAADRLYVCGFVKQKADEAKDNWYNLIAQGLTPLHQENAIGDSNAAIVIADYASIGKARHREGLAEARGDPSPAFGNHTHVSSSCAGLPRGLKPPRNDEMARCSLGFPSWLLQPPPPEPSSPRPLVPSRPSEDDPPTISPNDARFARGRLIHRLLQNLPEIDAREWQKAATRFLSNPQHALDAKEQQEIAVEVLRLLQDERFAPLFGPSSRAEQPIVGLSGERLIAGQVDRLALVGDEVWIVDYKTNRPPPTDAAQIPFVYKSQMDAYRTVLRAIYPAQKVRCFLLWTYTLSLMEVT